MKKKEKFNETLGYKKFTTIVIGIGAAVVMLGALLKLTHFAFIPGWLANVLLTAGLGFEAIIFALSAFEPVHSEPDWSLIYPQLRYVYDKDVQKPEYGSSSKINMSSSTNHIGDVLANANIDKDAWEKLGKGIETFSKNAEKMNEMSGKVTSAVDGYVKTVNSSAEALNKQTADLSRKMEELNKVYGGMLSAMNVKL